MLSVKAQCGATISTKHLALLSDEDANMWMLNMGELNHKYGPRKECRWC